MVAGGPWELDNPSPSPSGPAVLYLIRKTDPLFNARFGVDSN